MGKKAVTEEIREKIISLKKHTDKSNVQIAKDLQISEKCVRTTYKNFLLSGKVAEQKRSGRPSVLTSREEHIIFRLVRKNPRITYKSLASIMATTYNKAVSSNTIRRALLRMKINTFKALRKPMLKPTDRIKRYKWCKERVNWTIEQWKNVIFSDESNFELFNRKERVYVKR